MRASKAAARHRLFRVGHNHTQTFLMGKIDFFAKTISRLWILTPHQTVSGQQRSYEGSNSMEESGPLAWCPRMVSVIFTLTP